MFVTPHWRKRVGQNVGLGVGVGRDKLYVSQSNYRKRNEGGQLRQCFLGLSAVRSECTLGRRPQKLGAPDTKRERERERLCSGSFAADSNEMNLCKWQIWRGQKLAAEKRGKGTDLGRTLPLLSLPPLICGFHPRSSHKEGPTVGCPWRCLPASRVGWGEVT